MLRDTRLHTGNVLHELFRARKTSSYSWFYSFWKWYEWEWGDRPLYAAFVNLRSLISELTEIPFGFTGADLRDEILRNEARFPNYNEDLIGAAAALIRLQDTYNLTTRELVDGHIPGGAVNHHKHHHHHDGHDHHHHCHHDHHYHHHDHHYHHHDHQYHHQRHQVDEVNKIIIVIMIAIIIIIIPISYNNNIIVIITVTMATSPSSSQ